MTRVTNVLAGFGCRVRIALSNVGAGMGNRIDNIRRVTDSARVSATSVVHAGAVNITHYGAHRPREVSTNFRFTGAVRPPSMERADRLAPDLYDRGIYSAPRTVALHRHPADWVRDINPGGSKMPGRDNNCCDCARASERTWRGRATVAGASRFPDTNGEPRAVIQQWVRGYWARTSFDLIGSKLERLGPGSSAIIAVDYRGGGGHCFNAFNVNGRVVACDGQVGLVSAWPPTSDGLGFDETDVKRCLAVYIDSHGWHLRTVNEPW